MQQLEGIIIALIMIIILPMIIISINHNAFFIVLAFVLVINSLKNIHFFFLKKRPKKFDQRELIEELEEMINIDFQKFSLGIKIIRNLIIILFFIYCIFYMQSNLFIILTGFILIYWLKDIFTTISSSKNLTNYFINNMYSFSHSLFVTFISLSSILVIFYTCYIKF